MEKIMILLICFIVYTYSAYSFKVESYRSLDPSNQIGFWEDRIVYRGDTITLSNKCFFVDGQLPDEQIAELPFVFNNLNEALQKIEEGSESAPMMLYIAPSVYWMDDPDDPVIRKPISGNIPFARIVKSNWLTFYGLTDNPENVVIACNRGQTMGAEGNFTMFYFDGDGIRFENVTLGNYCNVDLVYPLYPKFNREKRSSTIVQAQLALCNSDKVVALNTRFISRLNSCPMVGAKRAFFQDCYFECTDDALCGTGVYHKCRFTFFSSKPFYSTNNTGAVFLDCDIDVKTLNRQYFIKVGTPVTLVDCRFAHETDSLFLGWTQDPSNTLRCYSDNITLNGKPVFMQSDKPETTVSLTKTDALRAYKIVDQEKTRYNIYNLLRRNDGWNPTNMEPITPPVATRIFCTPKAFVETGRTEALLKAEVVFPFYVKSEEPVAWTVSGADQQLVRLEAQADGSCRVIGTNESEETSLVIVEASTLAGLKAATEITVAPKFIEPPLFLAGPKLVLEKNCLRLDYQLDLQGRSDHSLVNWYRCADREGGHPILVAVSRLNVPELVYSLSYDDVGYWIMATIEPKHARCHAGKAVTVWSAQIDRNTVEERPFDLDFRRFPTEWQPEIVPGFWTVDSYKPHDTQYYDWDIVPGKTSWHYGEGIDNAKGYGLLQAVRGARLLYTPKDSICRDMEIRLTLAPAKSAGQGFGSATGQYMDVCIKFDARTLTGYALRIVRTTKYDHAVDFLLVRYDNGVITPISDPVSSTCYLSECTIELETIGNRLYAKASTTAPQINKNFNLPHRVALDAAIDTVTFAGLGIQHTGSTGSGATKLNRLAVSWKK